MRALEFLKQRRVLVIVAVLLAVLVIYISMKSCGVSTDLEYKYSRVTVGDVVKTISVSGKLDVLNSYTVPSRISGVVSNIYVDFNDRVRKGQVLATIDSSEIDQQLMKVAAQLERAKLDLAGARTELDTKNELYKENLIAKKDLDQAELNYRKILAQMTQFRVDYNIALKNKSYTRIISPAAGVVFSMEIKQNDAVSAAKPLFVIAEDLKKMYLTISVDESDIGRIVKGQKVTFTVSAFPSTMFEGNIDQVRFQPLDTEGIVTYQAIVICDNRDQLLKPGMTATATIVVSHKKKVKRIQNEAFIVAPMDLEIVPGKKYLWKKHRLGNDASAFKRLEVTAGIVGDYYTEILSDSVKVGDKILVGVDRKLKLKDNI